MSGSDGMGNINSSRSKKCVTNETRGADVYSSKYFSLRDDLATRGGAECDQSRKPKKRQGQRYVTRKIRFWVWN